MPLTVLSDSAVQSLLHSLEKEDIHQLQQSLADALHFYSTSADSDQNGCGSSFQPMRTSLRRCDGQTTLFMPASSNDGLGVKIVTLTAPDDASESSSSIISRSMRSLSFSSNSSSPRSSLTAVDAISPSESVTWDDKPSDRNSTPKGSLTLLDSAGNMRALINAEELTAFRTALASTMLFKKRNNVHDVVIFGAGKQAYWHARLALLLRGDELHNLTIINRNFMSAKTMVRRLFHPDESSGVMPLPRPKVAIMTPDHTEYERLLKSTLRDAAAVFCTTPSTLPLFPASILTNTGGRKKGRYICAVGSYKPHMCEIPPEVLLQAVAPPHSHHHHKHAPQGGAIVVDSVEACMREAGEIIQAGIKGEEVVELGELVMLRRDAERRRQEKEAMDPAGVEIANSKKGRKKGKNLDDDEKADLGLREWLCKGNVVYKSVGIGLMDVVVGNDLVALADGLGVGVKVDNF